MRKALCAASVALLLNSLTLFAQADAAKAGFSETFDSTIRKTLDRFVDIPGMAFVVIKDDRPIFSRAYGMADKEAGLKADADTIWYMGSTTKSFTAMVAAMIDKEGRIKLSDPLTKYTVGIQFKTPLPDKITVRDLLTHTSGLNNGALIHRTAFTGQIDKAEIAHVFAANTAIDEAIFGKYRYTNLGYNIYGLLLESNLKLKWQDEHQKRIYDPLGLTRTTAYDQERLRKDGRSPRRMFGIRRRELWCVRTSTRSTIICRPRAATS